MLNREKEIEILMNDGDTRSEAERHLRDGAVIFPDKDLDRNLEDYLDEWDLEEEYRDEYRKMVSDKIPAGDWGVVEYEGEYFYIMYVL